MAMKDTEGLISKLIIEGAVERRRDELRFTNSLCSHLAGYNPEECLKTGKSIGWRKMLQEFTPALGLLSNEEIAMTIALLDYFLNVVEAKRGF
jgi:hypothetical protein